MFDNVAVSFAAAILVIGIGAAATIKLVEQPAQVATATVCVSEVCSTASVAVQASLPLCQNLAKSIEIAPESACGRVLGLR